MQGLRLREHVPVQRIHVGSVLVRAEDVHGLDVDRNLDDYLRLDQDGRYLPKYFLVKGETGYISQRNRNIKFVSVFEKRGGRISTTQGRKEETSG